LPLAQIATAMPRRRLNQRAVSATSGAKVAEEPSRPMRRPCARLNCQSVAAFPASTKPVPRPIAPIIDVVITPKRSDRRPIRMPPSPKPSMVTVYGNDASARVTPNSAWTGARATEMTYIPEPPSVISASATERRAHA
jgi:hypothetical protein